MARILFVNKVSFLCPGGAETRIRAVAMRLAKMGHDVFLVCAKTTPGETREERIEGILVRRVSVLPERLLRRFPVPHYLPGALFYLVGPLAVLLCILRWRIDVIRDDMSPFPGLSVLAPFFGHRAMVVVHNLFGGYRGWLRYYPAPFALAGAFGEWLLLRGWWRYRAIATASPWLAEYVRDKGSSRIFIESIPNGIDLEAFSLRAPRGTIERIVSFGRFSEHKGLVALMAACAQLRDRGVRFDLTLIGAGPAEARIRAAMAKYALADRVRILPPTPRADLLRKLPDYDLFVLASESEGLPVALLEAMAARLPTVVAALPYATTLLDCSETRFYDYRSPGALTDALADVVANPGAAEARAERARRRVEGFHWDETARAELSLLTTGAGSRKRLRKDPGAPP